MQLLFQNKPTLQRSHPHIVKVSFLKRSHPHFTIICSRSMKGKNGFKRILKMHDISEVNKQIKELFNTLTSLVTVVNEF